MIFHILINSLSCLFFSCMSAKINALPINRNSRSPTSGRCDVVHASGFRLLRRTSLKMETLKLATNCRTIERNCVTALYSFESHGRLNRPTIGKFGNLQESHPFIHKFCAVRFLNAVPCAPLQENRHKFEKFFVAVHSFRKIVMIFQKPNENELVTFVRPPPS